MNKALNRKTSRIVCALVCIALILGVCASLFSTATFARADDNEDMLFHAEDVSPSNSQFASSSGSAPKSPDSWTGGGVAGCGTGSAVGGVMDLDTYANNKDSYYLNKYYSDEFPGNTAPDSPFGGNGDSDTNHNRNVLMINVLPSNSNGTAYGYTSSSITLTKNRYYMIKAWVRTGNFEQPNMGAAIRINGLDDDVAFNKINTVSGITLNQDNNYGWDENNKYGWKEYTFYIASSSYADQSVTISLQVGDRYVDEDKPENNYYYPATGYALFDNIQAYQITPDEFLNFQENFGESENTIIKDYSNKTSDKFSNIKGLDFKAEEFTPENWQPVMGKNANLADLNIDIYNGRVDFDEDNEYNLSENPYSSYGKCRSDSEFLILSSYIGDGYKTTAGGVSSKSFTIERHHYYRISAWIKSQDISGGSGATFAISAIRNSNQNAYEGNNLFAALTSCTGDSSNKARGGFSQYSLYVKGSALRDYEASVECWLGSNGESNASSGIAMFDNITIEEISPSVYSENSSGTNAKAIDMDTENGADGNAFVTFPETGITNGQFYLADSYDEFGYPLAPANWTKYTPDTVNTSGYSSNMSFVDTKGIISGLIPTDEETFKKYKDDFGDNAINPSKKDGSVLMLYGKNPTAFCYRSSDFTVTANTPGALSVKLWADGITGYGASLVLKNNSSVISSIEKIGNTDGFKTYTFYIEPDAADISTLSLEIWLGNIDRKNNDTKLSTGHVYVSEVAYAALGDDEGGDSAAVKFANHKNAYEAAKKAGNTQIGQAAYSFKSIDFSAYDYYDDSYVKYAYDWALTVNSENADSVRYGIFDADNRPANDSTIPHSFKNSEDAKSGNVLVLRNSAPAASTLSYNGSMSLSPDTYYKVTVSLKVAIPEQASNSAVGATLSLTGTKYSFKDIKDTAYRSNKNDPTAYVDEEAFQVYTFYIKAGSTESTVSLSVSLGDGDSRTKWCNGYVYINDISFTDITNVAYDEALEMIDDGDEYALAADLSVEDENPDDDNDTETPSNNESSISWWLIPSILFAIAILIALIGFLIRKIMEKRADKKGVVQKTASYDRAATLNREHNKNASEEDKVGNVTEPDTNDEKYESFDDDSTETTEKKPVVKQETENTENTESATENSETNETENATEETNTESESANENGAEESAATKEGQSEQKDEPKTESYMDRFDD